MSMEKMMKSLEQDDPKSDKICEMHDLVLRVVQGAVLAQAAAEEGEEPPLGVLQLARAKRKGTDEYSTLLVLTVPSPRNKDPNGDKDFFAVIPLAELLPPDAANKFDPPTIGPNGKPCIHTEVMSGPEFLKKEGIITEH